MKVTFPTVSILGCGWLGLPLAGHLHAMGLRVYGSFHSERGKNELQRWNIKSFQVDLLEPEKADIAFFKSKTLIVTVPPSKGGKEEYANNLERLLALAKRSGTKKVLFTSSTAVYPESANAVNEDSPVQEKSSRGNNMLSAELAVQKVFGKNATIVRLGGLIGPNRHPANFLSGKENVSGANVPVNFLSLEDAVRMIADLVIDGRSPKIYNLVCPQHPSKKEYYTFACRRKGIEPPHFDPETMNDGYKLVDGNRIAAETSIEYLTTDWKVYLRSLQ